MLAVLFACAAIAVYRYCVYHLRDVQVRPVPLEIRIQGFDVGHMGARLLAMARPVYGAIVNTCSPGNPALVFVPTRKQAQLCAIDVVTFAGADGRGESFLHAGVDSARHITDTLTACGVRDGALLHTASFGVGYLHEGMTAAERRAVEELYTTGYLGVLVVSVSLTWGFGLTAALVVVMDTVQYDGREHRYIGCVLFRDARFTSLRWCAVFAGTLSRTCCKSWVVHLVRRLRQALASFCATRLGEHACPARVPCVSLAHTHRDTILLMLVHVQQGVLQAFLV